MHELLLCSVQTCSLSCTGCSICYFSNGTPCSGLLLTFKLFSSLNHAGGGVGKEGAGGYVVGLFSRKT